MVLRKPYKFLIKHFRFIHLILALLSTYLLTKTYSLWNFFKEYVNSSSPIVPSGTSNEYFSGSMILACILVVVGSIIILVLMRMKKKPVMYYLFSIISISCIKCFGSIHENFRICLYNLISLCEDSEGKILKYNLLII